MTAKIKLYEMELAFIRQIRRGKDLALAGAALVREEELARELESLKEQIPELAQTEA